MSDETITMSQIKGHKTPGGVGTIGTHNPRCLICGCGDPREMEYMTGRLAGRRGKKNPFHRFLTLKCESRAGTNIVISSFINNSIMHALMREVEREGEF